MESPIKPELANGSGQESPKLAAGFGDRKNPPHKSLSLGAGFFQFYTRFRVFELNSLFISFRRVVPLIISDFTLYRVWETAQNRPRFDISVKPVSQGGLLQNHHFCRFSQNTDTRFNPAKKSHCHADFADSDFDVAVVVKCDYLYFV